MGAAVVCVTLRANLNPFILNTWTKCSEMSVEKAANQTCFTPSLRRSDLQLHLTAELSSPLFRSSSTPLLQPALTSFSPRRDHRAAQYVSIRSIRLQAPILRPRAPQTMTDLSRFLFLFCSYCLATSPALILYVKTNVSYWRRSVAVTMQCFSLV